MYLVDTSVWIDYLRGREARHVEFLRRLLPHPMTVGMTHLVYTEILQGARDLTAFRRLHAYFRGQRFHAFDDAAAGHASAARLYVECRRRGVTVRSTVDCLIAQCAIEQELVLLHHDEDFRRIATVEPALNEKSFLDSAYP